jgi:hypothetical protein
VARFVGSESVAGAATPSQPWSFGTLRAVPLGNDERQRDDRDKDAPVRPAAPEPDELADEFARERRAAAAVVERRWLVEGTEEELAVLLAELRGVAARTGGELDAGETRLPRADAAAPRVARAENERTAKTRAAEPEPESDPADATKLRRFVLRFRIRE